ncbi:hypothetical protein AUP68_08460 [Ilyonectria robusta]
MERGGDICQKATACGDLFNACAANLALKGYASSIRSAQGDFNLWCSTVRATSTGLAASLRKCEQRVVAPLETEEASHCSSEDLEPSSSKGSPASWDAISNDGSDPDFLPIDDTPSTDPAIVEHILYVWTILDSLTRISLAIRKAGTKYWFEEVDAALDGDAFEDFRDHLARIILRANPHPEALLDSEQKMDRASDYERLTSVQKQLVHANILRKHRIKFVRKSQSSKKRPETDEIERLKESPRPADAVIATDPSVIGSSSTSQPTSSISISRPPKLQPGGSLICPYCDDVLSSSYAKDEQSWRSHVAHDILPYSCFIEKCDTPYEMYPTDENLLAHMIDKHSTMRWTCDYCASKDEASKQRSTDAPREFNNAGDWEGHVEEAHGDQITAHQRPILAELNKRPAMGPLTCPLCDFAMETMGSRIDDHILQHLHEFALWALPNGSGVMKMVDIPLAEDADTKIQVGHLGTFPPLKSSFECLIQPFSMSQIRVAHAGDEAAPVSIALPCANGFRTLPVTALGTFSERLARLLDGESIDNAEKAEGVDFYIPLAPFERRLLDLVDERWGLLATMLSDDSIDALLPHLFHNWAWSYTVQSRLQDAFTIEDDIEKCENYRQMYDKGLHRMAWTSGYGRELFRIPPLRESNHDFLERLGSKPFWNIRFKPLDEDVKYWAILARMFLRNKPLMLFWMNAAERRRIFSTRNEVLEWHHSHYHIGQIVRIFDLWSRRPSNSEDVANLFWNVNYSALLELSMRRTRHGVNDKLVSYPRATEPAEEAETTESEDEGTSAESSNFHRLTDILNQAINANGAGMEVIHDSQTGTMRWHYANLLYTNIRPIDVFQDEPGMATQEEEERGHNHAELTRTREELHFEPGSYLELVDWDKLVPVALEDIPQRARQDLEDSRLKVEYDLVVWRASRTPCISYHFSGEDTLMQRRLCNGFDDAGDCSDGHIFLLVDFEGSSFGSDYVYYWAIWNDSAITVDPATKKLKLLTSPRGCRYRRIYADFDELAALRSQRREVDLASSAKETRSFLQHVLGAGYKPEYDTMLPYILAEQISVLSPVGAGSFGSVVKATWQRPPSLEHDEAETVDVVLKRLHSDFQASKTFSLFIHELRVAYSGLTGSSTGCTQFYGVTEIDAASFPGVDGGGTCLCFVFERANAGYLSEYIEQKCLSQAWLEVASAMASLFNGLNTLHRRDVLHR